MQTPQSTTRAAVAGALLLTLTMVPAVPALAAPTQVKPGFNVFSAERDVGDRPPVRGRGGAAAAPAQRPEHAELRRVRLQPAGRAGAPAPKFPTRSAWSTRATSTPSRFRAASPTSIAAPSRPPRTEGEMAGVLAHEISHVARCATAPATPSKSYMTQAGLGVLGGILGRGKPEQHAQIINDHRRPRNECGLPEVQPRRGDAGATSWGRRSWPAPVTTPWRWRTSSSSCARRAVTRAAGPRSSSATTPPPPIAERAHPAGGQARSGPRATRAASNSRVRPRPRRNLRGIGAAPTMAEIARGDGRTLLGFVATLPASGPRRGARPVPYASTRPPPATRLPPARRLLRDADPLELARLRGRITGSGVTIAPEGGVVDTGDGQQSIIYGVHREPLRIPSRAARRPQPRQPTIEQASADLITQIRQGNSHLQATSRGRRETIDGQPGFSRRSPAPRPSRARRSASPW